MFHIINTVSIFVVFQYFNQNQSIIQSTIVLSLQAGNNSPIEMAPRSIQQSLKKQKGCIMRLYTEVIKVYRVLGDPNLSVAISFS